MICCLLGVQVVIVSSGHVVTLWNVLCSLHGNTLQDNLHKTLSITCTIHKYTYTDLTRSGWLSIQSKSKTGRNVSVSLVRRGTNFSKVLCFSFPVPVFWGFFALPKKNSELNLWATLGRGTENWVELLYVVQVMLHALVFLTCFAPVHHPWRPKIVADSCGKGKELGALLSLPGSPIMAIHTRNAVCFGTCQEQ